MTADETRFTAIYDACRQRVWAYATARAGRQIADEVVSETFAIAWRRIRDVPEPALPWLLGVARNVLREGHRAEVRREALAEEQWQHAPGPAGDVAEQVAERMGVLRALAALSEDDREILILTAWQGLTPRDASRVLGCSKATFRVRLHRARRRLQQAVEQDEHGHSASTAAGRRAPGGPGAPSTGRARNGVGAAKGRGGANGPGGRDTARVTGAAGAPEPGHEQGVKRVGHAA
ncbi:sigma-70 family RNA polymerase sigma factor [Spirillospora sp. NPDC049652]